MDAKKYIENQEYNFVTKKLHSVRYRRLFTLMNQLSAEFQTKRMKILEIGSAQGKVFGELDPHFDIEYVKEWRDFSVEKYGDKKNFKAIHGNVNEVIYRLDFKPDLIIALETFKHIPERDLMKLIPYLKTISSHMLYVIVPAEIGPSILIKNLGSMLMGYPRWKYYSMRELFNATFYRLDLLPRHDKEGKHYCGHMGFDWRWLAHTIRCCYDSMDTNTSPVNLVPTFLSPSIHFLAKNKVPYQIKLT